jgi:transglutaminase-like putative cysteine protease
MVKAGKLQRRVPSLGSKFKQRRRVSVKKIVHYAIMLTFVLSINFSAFEISYAASSKPSSAPTGSNLSPKYDKKAGLYGYVDASDKWVIAPKFPQARGFSEGIAAVADGLDSVKWGYIKPDATFAIKPQFLTAFEFRNGMAVVQVQESSLAGVINKKGDYIVKPEYYLQDANSSNNYLATLTDVDPNKGLDKHKYGMITNKGAVIKPQFDAPPATMANFTTFFLEDSSQMYGRKYFMALDNGKTLPLDAEIASVTEGMGLIEYFVDKSQILARSNGQTRYAFITEDGKIIKSYKDSAGKQYPFLLAHNFSEGFASVAINKTRAGTLTNDRWGFLKKDGTWLAKPAYVGAGSFKDGIAPVISGLSWGYINRDLSWFIEPQYVKTATKIDSAFAKTIETSMYNQEELDYTVAQAKSIVQSLVNNSMSDYEKLDRIYSYITKNVIYDDNYYSGNIPRISYTAYGALKYNIAVCEGYSELLSLMLNLAGVENKIIAGTFNSNGEGHAWNLVQLNGKYYHVDATWDAGNDRREYFLKSDAYMQKYKTWDTNSYPKVDSDYQA